MCDLWFLTRGCTHDELGGCTMCNYGKGSEIIQQEAILEELQKIVEKLPWEFEDFLLTPSGSMLDECEVPPEMRRGLKLILKDVKAKRFIIETRADSVTQESLDFLRNVMPGTEKYVEIGYESGNDWILRNCINKGTDSTAFERAARLIHNADAKVTANIAVGIPFLSERASINEAVCSVQSAFRQGADSVVLFPYHVKRGTLLETLYQEGWYHCVSFWSLVEVLAQFPEELLEQLQISWYKDYFGAERSNIIASPTSCEFCRQDVLHRLDAYRENPSKAMLCLLKEYQCDCRDRWEQNISQQEDGIAFEKIEAIYRALGKRFKIHQDILESELLIMKQTM